jgi:hypothetical protein
LKLISALRLVSVETITRVSGRASSSSERFEPVHYRHLNVQQNDVGGAPGDVVDRHPAVGVARHDFEPHLPSSARRARAPPPSRRRSSL